jgi:hypothetical protein
MHLNGSTGVLEERNIGSAWGREHKVIFGIQTVSFSQLIVITWNMYEKTEQTKHIC